MGYVRAYRGIAAQSLISASNYFYHGVLTLLLVVSMLR